jgi:trehalose 6-phosphate phosphatase
MATDAGGPPEVDPENSIPAARLAGRPLLLMLDVDGTLAPIAPRPSLAQVPDETRAVLASLATRPSITVVLVSGRAARDAQRVVGVDNLWTIGNHGAEVIDPRGDITVDAAVARYGDAIAREADTLGPTLAQLDGIILENKQWTLSIHYRLADDAVVPRLRTLVAEAAARNGLLVTQGKRVLEIRPPANVDKGTAIRRLAERLGAFAADASVLFAGDDVTDEDAFQMLRAEFPRAVTIHVGDNPNTAAEFTLATPEEMRALLERIAHDIHT